MTNNPFKLRSGNGVPFKRMGSSPVKQSIDPLDLGLIDEAKKVKVYKQAKPFVNMGSKDLSKYQTKAKDIIDDTRIGKNQAKTHAKTLVKDKHLKKRAKRKMYKTVGKKILSRAIPYVGWGLLASDIYGVSKKMKSGKSFKQSVKSQVLGTD